MTEKSVYHTTVDESGAFTLPDKLLDELSWKVGDELSWETRGEGRLILSNLEMGNSITVTFKTPESNGSPDAEVDS